MENLCRSASTLWENRINIDLTNIMAVQAEAEAAMRELRATYATGKTKSFEWRSSQLKAIKKIVSLHSEEIVEALRSDLQKPEFEAVIHEVGFIFMLMFMFIMFVCSYIVNLD